MSHLAQLSVLIGFFLPLLIAVVQKSHWSRAVRTTIGVLVSLITATIAAILHGDITLHTWGTSAVFVLGAALLTYRNIWVPLGAAPWIESNINGSRQTRAQQGYRDRAGVSR